VGCFKVWAMGKERRQGGQPRRQQGKAARRQAADKERLRAQREDSSSQGEPALVCIGVTGGGFAGTDEESHTPAAISAAFATAATFVRRAIQGGQPLLPKLTVCLQARTHRWLHARPCRCGCVLGCVLVASCRALGLCALCSAVCACHVIVLTVVPIV
jgi:hypothetical protein